MDIITEYCFARSFNTLDGLDDFTHPLVCAVHNMLPMFWLAKYFPFLISFTRNIPTWLIPYMSSEIKAFAQNRRRFASEVDGLLANPALLESVEHETVYHHLLEPSGTETPSRSSLIDEAQNLLVAGSDTVGNTCTVATLYILNDKNVRAKLTEELRTAWHDPSMPFTYQALEKLPYLVSTPLYLHSSTSNISQSAVIKESLRLSHGVVTPLPRVVGPDDASIGGFHVPAGVCISNLVGIFDTLTRILCNRLPSQ